MSGSNYTENNIIQASLRGVTYPVPSAIYVALFTADPTDGNVTANEVQASGTWSAYAREDAAQGDAIGTGWDTPADGVTSNSKTIEFAANNGLAAVNVTHVGLYDSLTDGNLLYHMALDSSKNIETGDVMAFAIGSITITAS